MKIIELPILVLAATILTAIPCSAAGEKAFTAIETVCYSCVCPTCDEGTITALPDGTLQLRNREAVYFYTAGDARAAGYFRVALNTDTDSAFAGTLWGTFYSCDTSGNRIADGWEGTWNGQLFRSFPSNWINKSVAYGFGTLSGLRMEATTAYGDSFVGTVVGTIQDSRK